MKKKSNQSQDDSDSRQQQQQQQRDKTIAPTTATSNKTETQVSSTKKAPKTKSIIKQKHGSKQNKQQQDKNENATAASLSSTSTPPRNSSNKKKNAQTKNNKNTPQEQNVDYPPHWNLEDCVQAYHHSKEGSLPRLVRGTLRVLPHSSSTAATSKSFVSCDRGQHDQDICIPTERDRNRAMDGDVVYVQLMEKDQEETNQQNAINEKLQAMKMKETTENEPDGSDFIESDEDKGDEDSRMMEEDDEAELWQDDPTQMALWNPLVSIPKPKQRQRGNNSTRQEDRRRIKQQKEQEQKQGRVVFIVPPAPVHSEVTPTVHSKGKQQLPTRRIVGTLKVLKSGKTILLTPNNKSLPQFKCPVAPTQELLKAHAKENDKETNSDSPNHYYYQAEYEYGTWKETHKWPPCVRVKVLGQAWVLEDEIQALLTEHDVDHGPHSAAVLKSVDQAVQSGVYHSHTAETDDTGTKPAASLGWKPTPEMYEGRRDYRSQRIFTIDPTTAKDLDDALHITELPDGTIEMGVHIADVSHFVKPNSPVDLEAARRATTVYLVDRTVPMLPRPLCEVACSLNENVERLAFSCVWRMKKDGTLVKNEKNQQDFVWYGRTVIKSCARLDYATAQNIIERKVATGEEESGGEVDESLWPKSRQPSGEHSIAQVAADVRLMHRVAMARRKLRFENGALALHGIKLTFQLDTDGQTPLLTEPYPIRDSNRLVEEYMLLANYLVAQRLLTHTGDLALLRNHGAPDMDKLDDLVMVVKAATGFDMDVSSSQSLHASLVELERNYGKDPLVLKCVTQLLMNPMVPADYFAAGTKNPEDYHHFGLAIPYYTHFTSPIRRYPDALVHRLLQRTIDGSVSEFELELKELQRECDHCNDKRMKSKKAQERCDRVFLSLFVKSHPIKSQLGVVLSVGKTSFTVFVPSLGVNALLYLQEHKDILTYADEEQRDGTRRILLQQKAGTGTEERRWETLEIVLLTKLQVTITCRDEPPVDVKLRFEGPWRSE